MSDIYNNNPLYPKEYSDADYIEEFADASNGLFGYSNTFGFLLQTGDDSHKKANTDIIIFAREFAERKKIAGHTQFADEDTQSNGTARLQSMIDGVRSMLKTDIDTERELINVGVDESKIDLLAKNFLWRNASNMYAKIVDHEDMSAYALIELIDLLSNEKERSADADEFLRLVQDITEEAQFTLECIYC